jgi:transcriptional regulator with XRE-family HTH domain
MAYKSEHIAERLRVARKAAGLSQRELSMRSGLTQSHISQIERGEMEPGLSSLVDLTRALDLEVVLVPRKMLPAIRSIVQSASISSDTEASKFQQKEVARFERLVIKQKQLYGPSADLDTISGGLKLLRNLPMTAEEIALLQTQAEQLKVYQASPRSTETVRDIAHTVRRLRNEAVHRDSRPSRSAYGLAGEDDDA